MGHGARLMHGAALIFLLFTLRGLPAQDLAMIRSGSAQMVSERQQVGISLVEALDRLSQAYRIFFTYEIALIENKQVLSIEEEMRNIEDDLDRLLKGSGLTYKKIGRRNYAIIRLERSLAPDRRRDRLREGSSGRRPVRESMQIMPPIMTNIPRYVRPVLFTVTGVITDQEGQPLTGVNILVKGSNQGTVTDIDGRFSLDLPDGDQVLVVSYIGYQTLEVPVAGRASLPITLAASSASLDEVVVIGYGSVRRSDLTGSVSQVSSKDIDALPVPNIEQALRGRSAGVRVTQNSGQPGAPVQIQIRGGNSFLGNNNPLFVVDGFPLTGGIDFLNPSDIQSIDILKDASATAIYGARGANGVVIITTKSGGSDRGRVTFDSYYGIQTVRRTFDLMNGRQFAEIANERAQNDGVALPFDLNNLPDFNTDWQDAVFQAAPIQSYTLSFDGTNNKTRYSVSGNYFSQDGVVVSSGIRRGSLRLGLDQEINDRLTVSTHFVGTRFLLDNINANNGHRGDNILSSAYVSPPTAPVRNEDGSLSNVSPYFFSPNVLQHPLLYAQITDKEQLTTLLADLSAELAITKDLSFKVIFGTEQNFSERNFYSPSTVLLSSPTGEAATSINRSVSYLNENILTYTKSFNRDKLILVGGFTYQDFQSRFNRSSGSGFVNDILLNNNLGADVLVGPFTWDVFGQISFNQNKVIDIGGSDVFGGTLNNPFQAPINIAREGQPLGIFYGFREDGLNEDGSVRYLDLNGDGQITNQDQTIIGNPYPDFIFSLNNNFSFQNFELNVFFEGVRGSDLFFATAGSIANSFNTGENQLVDVYNSRWSTANPDPNAAYPKISARSTFRVSDRFVKDASYLRLRNVRLAYNLRLGANRRQALQLYVSGQNLLTVTDYPGLDPEVNTRGGAGDLRIGIDETGYPTAKSVTVGLKLGF